MQYEWDNRKAADNLGKHGVDFADAIAALEDANRLEEVDTRFAYGEERMQVIGMAYRDVLFEVVTVHDDDICRIISAERPHHMSKTSTTGVTVKRGKPLPRGTPIGRDGRRGPTLMRSSSRPNNSLSASGVA